MNKEEDSLKRAIRDQPTNLKSWSELARHQAPQSQKSARDLLRECMRKGQLGREDRDRILQLHLDPSPKPPLRPTPEDREVLLVPGTPWRLAYLAEGGLKIEDLPPAERKIRHFELPEGLATDYEEEGAYYDPPYMAFLPALNSILFARTLREVAYEAGVRTVFFLFDLSDGRFSAPLSLEFSAFVEISQLGNRILMADEQGFSIYDLSALEGIVWVEGQAPFRGPLFQVEACQDHRAEMTAQISPSGTRLATWHPDELEDGSLDSLGTTTIFDVASGRLTGMAHRTSPWGNFSFDDLLFVKSQETVDGNGNPCLQVQLFDGTTHRRLAAWDIPESWVAAYVTADGEYLVAFAVDEHGHKRLYASSLERDEPLRPLPVSPVHLDALFRIQVYADSVLLHSETGLETFDLFLETLRSDPTDRDRHAMEGLWEEAEKLAPSHPAPLPSLLPDFPVRERVEPGLLSKVMALFQPEKDAEPPEWSCLPGATALELSALQEWFGETPLDPGSVALLAQCRGFQGPQGQVFDFLDPLTETLDQEATRLWETTAQNVLSPLEHPAFENAFVFGVAAESFWIADTHTGTGKIGPIYQAFPKLDRVVLRFRTLREFFEELEWILDPGDEARIAADLGKGLWCEPLTKEVVQSRDAMLEDFAKWTEELEISDPVFFDLRLPFEGAALDLLALGSDGQLVRWDQSLLFAILPPP